MHSPGLRDQEEGIQAACHALECAGTQLVKLAIEEMVSMKADEVVLEAEVTNQGALALYHNLGFLRDKRLIRRA